VTNDLDIRMHRTLRALCNRVVLEFPEAAGLAVVGLSCGCMYACGVSFTGDPVGELRAVNGRTGAVESGKTVCLRCRRDRAGLSHRIVERWMVWPGQASEKPDRSLREFIGQHVFGGHYRDPEDDAS
jgi:hypothetical protein